MVPVDPVSSPLPESIKKLGIKRWVDLALHFPLRYENESLVWAISQVVAGQFAQIQVRVVSSRIVFRPRRMLLIEVEDDTGSAVLRFIYFKEAQKNAYPVGQRIRVLGEARRSLAGLEFIHPRLRSGWLSPEEIGTQPLMPVYPTTAGLQQATLRRSIARALQSALPDEWLPPAMLAAYGLMSLPDAIRLIHQPPSDAEKTGVLSLLMQREGPAWNRVRFDELLAQQVALRRARYLRGSESAEPLAQRALPQRLSSAFGFQMTAAQHRVWQEIARDLERSVPMQRLLQGDVGSGKTVIAALAAAQAVGSGRQVAVMAPTEILAEQLFGKFLQWFGSLGVRVELLKGGLNAKQRRELVAEIAQGAVAIVVGTHALIQKDIRFPQLGLVIVDEQHRFGVGQRLALRTQVDGLMPHMLAMSATPIPRSLAMTYLADLDVSVLDERPPNRQPIITKLMASSRREELADKLQAFIAQGGQAYWVCPVIEGPREESDAPSREENLQAIETAAQWLRPLFGDQLVVLHGRMAADDKQLAMQDFSSGRRRLMLSTTVIEVGVDVPRATLMVIEHAERFGLAQLHQLRGRIGRGAEQSTCILLFDEPLSDIAKERLKTLYETDDGFEVARRDLAIRGPGEVLGLRQSGIPALRYSDLQQHVDWVERAIQFGAELSKIALDPRQASRLGLVPQSVDALIDRWAYEKEGLLAGG
ncbi:MAG: ATP-dependent DNA helicase RecG [Burkholderiaceae bacterium]|nr:ATP-dependent DNA helicase RecG [Burkholderiaceae bacterium]